MRQPRYATDQTAYMGSLDDGAHDPHVGYADYDFDSLMHYPVTYENEFSQPSQHRERSRPSPFLSEKSE